MLKPYISLKGFHVITNWKVPKLQFREVKFPTGSILPYIGGYTNLVLSPPPHLEFISGIFLPLLSVCETVEYMLLRHSVLLNGALHAAWGTNTTLSLGCVIWWKCVLCGIPFMSQLQVIGYPKEIFQTLGWKMIHLTCLFLHSPVLPREQFKGNGKTWRNRSDTVCLLGFRVEVGGARSKSLFTARWVLQTI
jgi:hypothetical protein